jgi:uncharacterized phage protein gp47/JayE
MSNDYKSILNRLLDNVDDTLDKRQGSIIYDALAPAAMELAECYVALEIYQEQTYLKTATGENLDNRVADYGITRNPATNAIRIANIYNTDNELYDIDIGSRFSSPEDYGGYNFITTEKIDTGKYKLECETAGSVGNEYIGILLPLYNIKSLGKAEIVGTFEAAEDIEDDESLRKRALNKLNKEAFGGNQADYQRYLESIDGVGGAKIFPIWNGGGTVKVSFINSDYTIPSTEFINEVQTLLDPIQNQGEGLGLAPIGHTVTVVAPNLININITATIELLDDYTLAQVKPEIEEKLEAYILELQQNWENSSKITIYISRVIANILTVYGINNVASVLINDKNENLVLEQTTGLQQFPKLNEVILNEDK